MSGEDQEYEKESDTEYDGPFSYAKEVHGFVNGLFKGVLANAPQPTARDSQAEIHYFRGGYMLGLAVHGVSMYAISHYARQLIRQSITSDDE